MIPNKSLISPTIVAAYISPDDLAVTALVDYELGGVGLSDASQGLEYQTWTLNVTGSATTTAVELSAPNTAATQIFARPNITWARLAFDQNMRPVIAFIDQGGPTLYWYDSTIPGNTFTSLSTGATYPCCTMDDKRASQTRLGNNDVIVSYVKNGNLYYLQQRDRYATEYVLKTNLNTIIANPFLNKVGMDADRRLLFEVNGQLYT